MKKNSYTLLSLSILTALYSAEGRADLKQQCLSYVPHFQGEVVKGNPNDQPVYINADRAEINQPSSAVYEGDVDIKQGNRHLQAKRVEITQSGEDPNVQRYAYAKGGFDYKDEMINMTGDDAKIHLNSKDTDITNADYQLVDRQGRGSAENVEMRENYRLLTNAVFTSCLLNSDAWAIEAKEMRQYIKEEYDMDYTVNVSAYKAVADSLKSLAGISNLMVIVSVILGTITLSFLILMNLRDRMFEIGILLSVGETKMRIMLQMLMESFCPVLLAITAGVIFSYPLANVIKIAVDLSNGVRLQLRHSRL